MSTDALCRRRDSEAGYVPGYAENSEASSAHSSDSKSLPLRQDQLGDIVVKPRGLVLAGANLFSPPVICCLLQ
jgi:hypothetical protein